ncbi:MAG: 1-deoxy-D-xylulose-5-phosphate synthase [Lachnospiraceae bacterium]|nr:1-deoxy-D-xylulose-5-phosphate synthase [Lachnospiraceae bacterium]
MLLEQIKKPNDIKKIPASDMPALAAEIREFLVNSLSETGGHLGPNLGTVELTMALHMFLDLPKDKLIWDVGHQSYTHKLLTGRMDGFSTLRQYQGLSGFPKRSESDCDCFETGHSSTSLSAGIGFVRAKQLTGEKYTVVSVIGDGSFTGGLAYEALNNASKLNTNFIIVLNDNNMSIAENVGGVAKYLNTIRTADKYLEFRDDVYNSLKKKSANNDKIIESIRRTKNTFKSFFLPGMFFEEMGITYLGPVDGHNINELLRTFKEARRVRKAVIVHVKTEKGRGYEPAIKHPARFHGTGPFDIETGIPKNPRTVANYTDIFSTVMCKMGKRDEKVVAVTAAMPGGTGLNRFRNMYPERFFDVGIAEGHAVTFAAGLAAGGLKPVVAVYSSFLQRAYDEILHDVCRQNLPVVFALDRAGIVGADGETHQGIYDLSYLSSIPGLTVMAPKNKWELSDMLKYAISLEAPVAIRYPNREAYTGLEEFREEIITGKSEVIYRESGVCLLAVGSMVRVAEKVRERMKEAGKPCTLVNARFVKPLDVELIRDLCKDHELIVTMEENEAAGGYGSAVSMFMEKEGLKPNFLGIAAPDIYMEQGAVGVLMEKYGMDDKSVFHRIQEILK